MTQLEELEARKNAIAEELMLNLQECAMQRRMMDLAAIERKIRSLKGENDES